MMTESSTTKKPFDPPALVLAVVEERYPRRLNNVQLHTLALRKAQAESAPLAMALLFVLAARLNDDFVEVTAAGIWRDKIDWDRVDPSTAIEGEGARDHITKTLGEMAKFSFTEPDITMLQDFRGQPLLLAGLYWSAYEFVSVGDEAREEAAREVVNIVGPWLGLPEYVPEEA